ncbi:MAG: Stage II sporulation protein [Candidatus Woesebacteria bacterium GW2011_GWF2_46_8]|uniref:Stage II sporulation protein n=1 Tax=Candidatus Woesebacteria bacterium GW2011_GWF2_46_8 TaxID=1618604 RepID=A0A0G1QV05_9BACT|nr:MAG: Stage II sporulation protein [Candidatus Woesebacteria bacterium GW2011_GWF2_46_8]
MVRQMKFLRIFLFVFFFITAVWFLAISVKASHCPTTDYDCQIAEIQKDIDALSPAHEKNKQELANLKKQLDDLKRRIASISTQLRNVESEISQREEDMAFAQRILDEKALSQYIDSRLYDPILSILSASDASEAFRRIKIREIVADEDRKTVEKYAQDLLKLREDKENLEKAKASLASLQNQVNEKAKFLEGEVAEVETYLASLSAKQQEILAAKSGSFIVSVGDSELADDYNASIRGFREAAPSGSFAAFSFGGYTHRKGMSQYGARGRAQNNQNYRDILKAYYGKEPVAKDTSGTISVSGYGNLDFETTYLWGIAEMPSSWHPEALKAQAVAARTYAYRYKIEGKTICTTEACQVFRKSKADNPPNEWKQAVIDTRGQVLEDVVTYYSSTAGGYLTTMGWDTTDGGGGSNFFDKTYEKLGGSPWAYKSWYRKGYSSSGDSCGRGNPWLSNEEFTDIVNAAVALKENKGDKSRITPTTTSCWGGNPYSYSELRSIGGVNSVSSVVVTQGNGSTTQVIINGLPAFSGDEFKTAFNLRAPGYLMIPQKGFAFFNIERK